MRIRRLFLALCVILGVAASAYAWAPGTHAFIVTTIHPNDRNNVVFGAVAPDINQVLSSDQNSNFFSATHYDFTGMWYATAYVTTPAARSLALGYVSHNEVWGADRYAHIQSHLYSRYGNPDTRYPGQNGYVWVKAAQLCSLMKQQTKGTGGLSDVLLSDPMNCHFIVEYGIDLLLKATRDPQIGQKLLTAASTYDQQTLATLFVAAYPKTAPVPFYPYSEGVAMAGYGAANWTQLMQAYATALGKPTMKEAVPAVAGFLEMLAEQLLGEQIRGTLGLGPNDGIPDPVKQQLTKLIELGLTDSLFLCSYDFRWELDSTIISVEQNLRKHDIHF